jgi:hypothetical protein
VAAGAASAMARFISRETFAAWCVPYTPPHLHCHPARLEWLTRGVAAEVGVACGGGLGVHYHYGSEEWLPCY